MNFQKIPTGYKKQSSSWLWFMTMKQHINSQSTSKWGTVSHFSFPVKLHGNAYFSWQWCVTTHVKWCQPRKLTWALVSRLFIGVIHTHIQFLHGLHSQDAGYLDKTHAHHKSFNIKHENNLQIVWGPMTEAYKSTCQGRIFHKIKSLSRRPCCTWRICQPIRACSGHLAP